MNRITIVGVGLRREDLTLGAMEAFGSGAPVVLRTGRCACAEWLRERGISFQTLDHLYEQARDFDQLGEDIAGEIERMASEAPLTYAVPDVRDQAVRRLIEAHKDEVSLIPGVGVDAGLSAYATEPCQSIAACDAARFQPESEQGVLARELYSREAASELKLRLMERYPEGAVVYLMPEDGRAQTVPLYALDRLKGSMYGHGLCAYVPAVTELKGLERYGFDQLNRIVRVLRGPDGCPWDKKQTHETLEANVVEEAYEVVDAIERNDMDALYDELGDLLLQVALHAEIARQHGEFSIDDVTTAVCRKLISRHAHIFGDAVAQTPDEVLLLWEQAKKKEKRQASVAEAMDGVTKSLPQLMRAEKVQKKAAQVGFDWDDAMSALDKVYEEADEVKGAIRSGEGHQEELGDLLFACVNTSRLMKVEPELALGGAVDKFIRRFAAMEQRILADGRRMEDMNLKELDQYWALIKQIHVKP